MRSNSQALRLTVLFLMAALELIFSFTKLGTIPMGPLAITLNIIPIGISAVVMGPIAGGALGGFFGILSFLQCFSVGVPSEFGAELVKEDITKAAIVCIVSRMLAGFIAGILHDLMKKKAHINPTICGAAAGACAALFNTILFMTALIFFFGSSDYISDMIAGRSMIVFIFAFVGMNALIEMLISTVITGASAFAMGKTRLFGK